MRRQEILLPANDKERSGAVDSPFHQVNAAEQEENISYESTKLRRNRHRLKPAITGERYAFHSLPARLREQVTPLALA